MTKVTLVPITWLRAHEEHVESRVREVLGLFLKRGCVDYAVVADAATGTVVDGHHRLEALRRLRAHLVPVHLIDYMDPAIHVRNWREDEPPVTKEDVLCRAREGRLFPPKTTRHDYIRVLDPVDVPLTTLEVAAERVHLTATE